MARPIPRDPPVTRATPGSPPLTSSSILPSSPTFGPQESTREGQIDRYRLLASGRGNENHPPGRRHGRLIEGGVAAGNLERDVADAAGLVHRVTEDRLLLGRRSSRRKRHRHARHWVRHVPATIHA